VRAVVIVAVAPIFLVACGPAGGGTAPAAVAGPTFEAPGPPVVPVPPWQVQAYASVSPTATAAATTSPAATSATSTSTATAVPTATVTPGPCLPLDGPNGGPALSATTVDGTHKITLSWFANGDPATTDYRVTVMVPMQLQPSPSPSATSWVSPNPQITPTWITIAAPADCRVLSTTLTGIPYGTYDLYLERDAMTPENAPRSSTRETLGAVHGLQVKPVTRTLVR
jgi:hypothetical protein